MSFITWQKHPPSLPQEQAAVTKVEQQMLIEHKMWCSDLYIPPFAKGKHRRIKEEEKVSAANNNKDFEIYVY